MDARVVYRLLTGSQSDDYLWHWSQLRFNRGWPTYVLTRLLYANRIPPPDQVRGHASLENAKAIKIAKSCRDGCAQSPTARKIVARRRGCDASAIRPVCIPWRALPPP